MGGSILKRLPDPSLEPTAKKRGGSAAKAVGPIGTFMSLKPKLSVAIAMILAGGGLALLGFRLWKAIDGYDIT